MQPVNTTVAKAVEYLHDWKWARLRNQRSSAGNIQQQSEEIRWHKPIAGWYKCNIDAAMFNTNNKYGLGMCIHSHVGEFYKGKMMWFHGTPTPQEAEAVGLRQALLWLVELGLTSVYMNLITYQL